AAVLGLSIAFVWLLNRNGFASWVAVAGRVALSLTIVAAVVALVWYPLRKLGRREGAMELERLLPAQSGRIETYLDARRRETQGVHSPLLDLLAGDALRVAQQTPVEGVVTGRRLLGMGGVALVAFAILALLLAAGPAFWGFGTRHLLLGAALPRTSVPVRRI